MTTPTEDNGSGKITYTVRELLTELKTMVQTIDAKLDAKAEKSVVENLVTRMGTIETERKTEREYGNQIFAEYKELLKEHTQVKLDISALQQNKKDKEAFNFLWVPVIFNGICTLALGVYGVLHVH